MKNYLVIYRAGDTFDKSYSEQEQQDIASNWKDWVAGFRQNLVSNSPVTRVGSVLQNGERSRLRENASLVNGYILLEANDLDHAVEICESCPLYAEGKTFEIREMPEH